MNAEGKNNYMYPKDSYLATLDYISGSGKGFKLIVFIVTRTHPEVVLVFMT